MNKQCVVFCAFILFLCGCNQAKTENGLNIQAFNQIMNAVDAESIKLHELSDQLNTAISLTEKKQIACRDIPRQYDVIEILLNKNRDHIVSEHISLVDDFLARLAEQRISFKNSHYC